MFTHDIFQIQLCSKRSIVPIIVRITGIGLQKFPAKLSRIILFVRSYGVFLIEFLRIWKTETNFFRKGMHFFFQYRAQRGESCNPHQFRVSIDFGRWWKKRGYRKMSILGGIASNFQNSRATKMGKLSRAISDCSRCIGSHESSRVYDPRELKESSSGRAESLSSRIEEKLTDVEVLNSNLSESKIIGDMRLDDRWRGGEKWETRGGKMVVDFWRSVPSNQSFLYLS